MTNTNYPSASPTTTPQRSSNSKNIVIGLLAVALLGSWAYFLMKINRSDKEILSKTEEGVHYMSQRDSLESLYKFTLDKYDSVTVANNDLSGKLTTKQTEISKLKAEINSILKKKNATSSELARAKTLIDELNSWFSSRRYIVRDGTSYSVRYRDACLRGPVTPTQNHRPTVFP